MILLFTLILSFSVIGCKKDKDNVMRGIITELLSGNEIQDVKVILEANGVSSGSINTTYFKIAETYTDANGFYEIIFEPRSIISYRISFIKENFIPKTIDLNPIDYIAEYEINEKMAYSSVLKLRVKNNSPVNDNDRLMIRISSIHNEFCSSCCHNDWRNYYGTNVNEFIICPSIGGDSLNISTIIYKGNNTIMNDVKLKCPINDTLTYYVNY